MRKIVRLSSSRVFKATFPKVFVLLALAGLVPLAGIAAALTSPATNSRLEAIQISKDGKDFVSASSQTRFKAWGFNYDHDTSGRLLEDYWDTEWKAVEADFAKMKALGANTVRVHLQVAKFMNSATEPNPASLGRLGRLLSLAENTGVYLDITGLGCYEKKDVPRWYDELEEAKRWDVQARFWEAVADTCKTSPAIFCYDLMNEPVVTGDGKDRDWTPGEFGGKHFVQRLTLELAGRTQQQVAKAWVDKLVSAIRRHDRIHLVTVGAIPWALTWPTAKPLFYSKEVSKNLDFVSVHFYPKKGEVDKALTALAVYDIGKPLVIEEMFPLNCSREEMVQFIDGSKPIADGWLSFFWGKTPEEYRHGQADLASALVSDWLECFAAKGKAMRGE